MSPGDRILIHMHDTPAGFQVNLIDLTTGQSGSMTASIANGFGHILYTPNSSTCQEAPYAFHPEYSTANTRGNTWSAHTYNVAMSDEIGHFENCLRSMPTATARSPAARTPAASTRTTNSFCVPGTDSTLVMIDGCFSRRRGLGRTVLPARLARHLTRTRSSTGSCTRRRSCSPARPPSGRRNYSTIAFETDLPGLESAGAQDNPPFCDLNTGANCVDPPTGRSSIRSSRRRSSDRDCTVAGGRKLHPRHDQPLRRKRDRRVRRRCSECVPGARFHHQPPDLGLQQRRSVQPLPDCSGGAASDSA